MVLKDKFGDLPLEILFVGHNPSDHSWASGHYFSQPSNRFWKLLEESGLGGAESDDELLVDRGFGFTDVIKTPNADSSTVSRREFAEQHSYFYKRISIHANRVGAPPKRVAFVGKRQFSQLFDPPLKRVELGLQNTHPPGFPFECEIWVLSSPSGRAAMTWSDRLEPYRLLAESMHNAF